MKKVLIVICCLVLVGGRSNPNNRRNIIKPEPTKIEYSARWKALAIFVKQHFETDKSINWIAADLSRAAYDLGIE